MGLPDLRTWNYRIVKMLTKEGEHEYGIHEVYYDNEGKARTWTARSMVRTCDSREELLKDMQKMLLAFEKETIVDDLPYEDVVDKEKE